MNTVTHTFPPPIIIEPKKTAKHSVIWMHGLGADASDFVAIPPLLNVDELSIRFVFPNAPTRPITINGGMSMPGWYDIKNISSRNNDQQGITHSNQYIQKLIDQEMSKGISSQNVLLAGFSQGGALSIYSSIHCPHPLGGVIALSCYLLDTTEYPNSKQLNSSGNTPFFIAHGTHDPIVDYTLGQEIQGYLKDQKYPSTFKTYDMEHQVCQQELEDIGLWLNQHLN